MSSTDENQDLQTYFDTFKNEIEESDDCVTLTAEALRALSEADAVTEKILEEDAGSNTEDEACSDSRASNILKNVKGKKGIYYLKLSDKESIQVKLIKESSSSGTEQNAKNDQAAADDKSSLVSTGDESNCEREKIYEFNEDEREPNDCTESPYLEKIVKGGSLTYMVPRTNTSAVETQSHQCPKCPYVTNKRFLLSRHLHTHSEDRPYKCSVCDRGFKISPALVNHMNSHLGKKPHACTYCEMRFNTSGELMRHVRYKHTGEKPHKCAECDYSSVELSKMRRHMRCHTGERPYQCPHCTYASPDTFKLKRHLRTHTGEKPYECDICLARFSQSNSLKAHRLIHTAGDRPAFQCSYCPSTCGRKTDLQLHMQKLHNPENPVKCKRCGKELPDRYSYKVHIKTHEGEKCFRCKICPYASISQRHLDMHMLIHTDEKPFVCEHCGATFRQRQLVLRHINFYHNDEYVPPAPSEKTHVCPHCNRAFTRKGNLMRHMETHDSQMDTQEEKLKLKMGRQIRIQPDGSLSLPENQRKSSGHSKGKYSISKFSAIGDDEAQGYESFSILEIEDDDNDNDNDNDIEPQPLIKKSGPAAMLNTIKTIKPDPKKSTTKKVVTKPLQMKQRAVVKREKAEEKAEPTTVTVDIDDENEHYMVIEVIGNDAGDDSVIAMEDSRTHNSIIDLPTASNGKRNSASSFALSNVNEYILPIDCKSPHITIMDVIDDE